MAEQNESEEPRPTRDEVVKAMAAVLVRFAQRKARQKKASDE